MDSFNPTPEDRAMMAASTLPTFDNGRKKGCLRRQSRPGEHCPMASERIEVVPRDRWDHWKERVSLRPSVKTILDQNGYGSCAAEAVTQAIMIARQLSGQPHVLLNPWAMYRTTSGGRDQGSNIEDNIRYAMKYGVPSQAIHPRSKGVFGAKGALSDEAVADALNYRIVEYWDIATVDELVSGLLKGFSGVWGGDGHALCKVRHLNEREGEDANSWDTTWGDNGFGVWLPYSRINWSYGAFAIRVASMAA